METGSQMYLKLDSKDYDPGEYIIDIVIIDSISGAGASRNTVILWE